MLCCFGSSSCMHRRSDTFGLFHALHFRGESGTCYFIHRVRVSSSLAIFSNRISNKLPGTPFTYPSDRKTELLSEFQPPALLLISVWLGLPGAKQWQEKKKKKEEVPVLSLFGHHGPLFFGQEDGFSLRVLDLLALLHCQSMAEAHLPAELKEENTKLIPCCWW